MTAMLVLGVVSTTVAAAQMADAASSNNGGSKVSIKQSQKACTNEGGKVYLGQGNVCKVDQEQHAYAGGSGIGEVSIKQKQKACENEVSRALIQLNMCEVYQSQGAKVK